MFDPQLLRRVSPCATLNILSNWGMLYYNQWGLLILLPNLEVYYNSQSIANMRSMSAVTSKYRVTMDSIVEDSVVVCLGRN